MPTLLPTPRSSIISPEASSCPKPFAILPCSPTFTNSASFVGTLCSFPLDVLCVLQAIATDLFCERSGSDPCVEGFHKIQNHVNDGLIADHSIDHGVVNGAVRPLDAEILLDEVAAIPIHGIHELFGFLLTLAASQQAPHFIFSRSVKKHTQRVFAVP